MIFPGLDLNTRSRYRHLPEYFIKGQVDTLDAGCGNGALSYVAYKKGNNVLAVSFSKAEIARNKEYFSYLKVNEDRLKFMVLNLYELPSIEHKFDQIICSETLEHISDDNLIIKYFYDILRPGGVLHLCCPYSKHPIHNLGRTNAPEDGGHVREGYTHESYKELLEPVGFSIVESAGIGSELLQNIYYPLKIIRKYKYGDLYSLPYFIITYPLQILEHKNPKIPLSLYVKAVKK